LIIWNQNWKI